MKKVTSLSNVFAACAVVLCVGLLPVLAAHAQDSYDLGGGYDGGSSYDLGGGYSGSSYDLGGGYSGSSYDLSGGYTGSSYDLGGGYTGSSYDLGGGYTGSAYDLGGGYTGSSYDLGGGYTGTSYDLGGGYANGSNFSPDSSGFTNFSPDCGSNCYTNFSPDCGSSCYTYSNFSPDCGCYENGVSNVSGYSSGVTNVSGYSQPFSIPTPTSFPIQSSFFSGFASNFSQPIIHNIPTPIPVPPPIPQPPVIIPQPSVITNNTCTNGSCNYANNSVNNSGNTVTVLPIAQAPVSYPVQYTFPQPTPMYPNYPYQNYQNVYCTITAAPNQIQSGQYTYLQWQSTGAVSATLSGYGNVASQGSLSVRPTGSQNYVLTVYGYNGQSATCNTYITTGGAQQYPSVTLSQIPYTGFDFGALGDALYWTLLAVFALASGYLLVYYKGGMGALSGSFLPRFSRRPAVALAHVAAAPAVAPAIASAKVEATVRESAPSLSALPTFAAGVRPTSDSMRVSKTHDGTPRIVISRA